MTNMTNNSTDNWLRRSLSLLLACFSLSTVWAQGNDFGMWYEVGAEKKLSSKWSAGLDAEFRTRDDAKTADRWSLGASVDYRLLKTTSFSMKASGGYTLLYDNNPEKLTYKNSDGLPKRWTPSYWGVRHRVNLSLSASMDLGRWTIGLRERWQFTHRPEKANQRYAFQYDERGGMTMPSDDQWEAVKAKDHGMLRSRLQVEYNIKKTKIDPFASVEMFSDSHGIAKMRYQAGLEYKLSKQHRFSLTYRYQDISEDDDDNDVNSHLIGLGYQFKF